MVQLDQQGQQPGDGFGYAAFPAFPSRNRRNCDAYLYGELSLRHTQLFSLGSKFLACHGRSIPTVQFTYQPSLCAANHFTSFCSSNNTFFLEGWE